MTTTHVLKSAEVDIAYDVHAPLPTAAGRPPLFMIGQPMTATGFATLVSQFPERTVVTYDPRGLGSSSRNDGRVDDNVPTVQAHDVHAVIEALGAGPVEMLASSGGAAVDALTAAPTRVVITVGEESLNTFTGRTAVATAELLGQQATVFPSHQGGFLGRESGYPGQPEAFARKLRGVLDHDN
jgi:pimeloyl-ACP methyl ester carboxylesterase